MENPSEREVIELPVTEVSEHMAEAHSLVFGDRQAAYGSPREMALTLSRVWSGLLTHKLSSDLTPEDAALMLVALKVAREVRLSKRDNIVDAHGYLAVYTRVKSGR